MGESKNKTRKLNFIALMSVTAFFILTKSVFAQAGDSVSLDGLIKEAIANNPHIQEAYNNWKAAEYRIKVVKSLPDPMARYGYFGESVQTRTGPQNQRYGLSQKFPFPGKLRKKGKAQSKKAQMAKEKYEAAKREIIKKVKFFYYDLYWVDKALEVTEEEKGILENLEVVARRKYEANMTPVQDVVKAQFALAKLEERLSHLRQQRKSLVALMNSTLDRNQDTTIGKIEDVDTLVFVYQLEQLMRMAQSSRQELLVVNLDVERAEYEKSLARLNYFPDFTFGVDFIEIGGGTTTRPDDGKDAWVGMVSFNIPIWYGKLNAQLKEKKAKLEAAKAKLNKVDNKVHYEVQDMFYKISSYEDIVSLYETALIPQALATFEVAKIAYESGEVDFLNWLDAEKALLQTRLAYYKTVVDYNKSIAYLERIVGREL